MVSSPVPAATRSVTAPDAAAGHSAFISYASQDRRQALRVATLLEDAGIRVWLDTLNIPGGQSYGPEIVDGIRASTALVVLCSAASLTSRNVRQEIQLAWRYGRPILPLRLEDVTFPDGLAYWLEGAQWVDLFDQPATAWLPRVEAALARFAAEDDARSPGGSEPTTAAPLFSLPLPPTAILGRERELADLRRRRGDGARLITLTGPGGAGKTRLALEAAHELAPGFADGAVFVDLAPVTDPALVISALAEALGLRESGDEPLTEQVRAWLTPKRLLIVLDNFEHVVGAAGEVAALLASAPGLMVLATSRAPLQVRAEQTVEVGPLALPDTNTTAAIVASPAVALFLDRARAAGASLALSEGNARVIGDIVRRLDGLPLAIELAAARATLLPPEALLARLERCLPLLTGGAMDLPARQRTLRDTIAWSFDLLSPAEQTLLRRLAVFTGGTSFDAVEAVAMPIANLDLYDGLAVLMRQSLLRQVRTTGEPRFRMFETIREFAQEQLDASPDGAAVWQRHAAYFLALAEEAEPVAHGMPDPAWITRLEPDHDNLRTALSQTLNRDPTLALRLSGALAWFWEVRGYLSEGRTWLERALAASSAPEVSGHLTGGPATLLPAGEAAPPQAEVPRAKALWWAGELAESQLDLTQAGASFAAALAMYQAMGDQRGAALSLHRLGHVAVDERKLDTATEQYQASLAIWEALGDERECATVLSSLGNIAYYRDQPAKAVAIWTDAAARFRAIGDKRRLAVMQTNLGAIAFAAGDVNQAAVLHEEALVLQRELGEENILPLSLNNLGWTLQVKGDRARARDLFEEALRRYQALGVREATTLPLYGLAWVAWEDGDAPRATALAAESLGILDLDVHPVQVADSLMLLAGLLADQGYGVQGARLLGTADALRDAVGSGIDPVDLPYNERIVNAVRQRLAPGEMERQVDLGRARPADQVRTETLTLTATLAARDSLSLPPA